jgi:tripartite-type tricarboxylate transporter receptor subunit TctC
MIRAFLHFIAILTLCSIATLANAQGYPNKPLRLIVPFPPGGSTDLLGRAVALRLAEALGQPVLVDNRPGANTIVAYEATLSAPADGYTLLFESFNGLVLNPNLYTKLPYDAERDFAPVAQVATSGFIVVVNPSVQANTLQEFVALARANPGRINLASAGIGNSTHVAAESFLSTAGIKLNHVPYKGSANALPELINNNVQIMFDTPITSMPFVRSGKLRALAVSGAKRIVAMPDLPTIGELGYPGFNAGTYYSVVARRGTPQPIIDRLSNEIRRIAGLPELRDVFAPQGIDASPGSAEELGALLRTDRARFAKVIKAANISLD